MSVFLGVDAGTTSMKAALFDLQGHALAIASVEYPLETPGPARVELEAEVYWQSCCRVVRQALVQSGISPREVGGLAISSQGETFVAVDEAGQALRKAIVWLDNRAVQEALDIRAAFDPLEFYHATGQPESVPAWPACKMLWMKRHEPELFAQTRRFLLLEDYLILRMTGEYATTTALQTSSLFLDIRTRGWWQPMLDFVGLEKERFGKLVEPGTWVGSLTSAAALALGLSTDCFVASGGMDQVVSAVGAGNTAAGVVTETTGTALVALVSFDRPAYDPGGRLPCHVHAAPGAYAVMPWCQTAGMALRWFRDQFFGLEAELARASGIDPYSEMNALAAQVSPGAEGLVVLPHLEGTASPEYNPHARAVFYGATLRHTRGHFVRGILESVAYMLRKNLTLIEGMGVPVGEVRSLGGAARSPLWLQIKADVLQKPIVSLENEETSCLGAALMAAAAAGEFASLEEGTAGMVRVRQHYWPNPANALAYNRSYQAYLELYERLEPMFRFVEERSA